MKTLQFNEINNGLTPAQGEKIQKFIKQNYDKKISLVYTAVDSARYFQHKYYRGFLLPDIIETWGEYNSHIELKKMYLLKDIYSLDDIPKARQKKCIIIVDTDNVPVAYIPSTSVLTFEEFNEFIKKCENFLFVELMGCISTSHQEQAQYARSQF